MRAGRWDPKTSNSERTQLGTPLYSGLPNACSPLNSNPGEEEDKEEEKDEEEDDEEEMRGTAATRPLAPKTELDRLARTTTTPLPTGPRIQC